MATKHTTKEPTGMTPNEIIKALQDAGINQAAIARELKKSPQVVYLVVHNKSVSTEIHKAIAEVIGKDVKQIWPQHYLQGNPKRGRRMVVWNRKAA